MSLFFRYRLEPVGHAIVTLGGRWSRPRPLIGFAGFLQFFTATFHGDREQVELTVNALYPGT